MSSPCEGPFAHLDIWEGVCPRCGQRIFRRRLGETDAQFRKRVGEESKK